METCLCLCVFSCFGGSRKASAQASVIVRLCKVPVRKKMKLERGNNASFVAHFLKCPAQAGGAPFFALTKVSCLKSFTVSLIQITRAKAI